MPRRQGKSRKGGLVLDKGIADTFVTYFSAVGDLFRHLITEKVGADTSPKTRAVKDALAGPDKPATRSTGVGASYPNTRNVGAETDAAFMRDMAVQVPPTRGGTHGRTGGRCYHDSWHPSGGNGCPGKIPKGEKPGHPICGKGGGDVAPPTLKKKTASGGIRPPPVGASLPRVNRGGGWLPMLR